MRRRDEERLAITVALLADSALEDGIRDTAGMLGRRGLIKRVDRLYKKPRPGKKRLTKWPRKLEPLPGAETQVQQSVFKPEETVGLSINRCLFQKSCRADGPH